MPRKKGAPSQQTNADQELDKFAGDILGQPVHKQPIAEDLETNENPPYWTFDKLKPEEAEAAAYKRLEEYANNVYVETSYQKVMDGYGGSVVVAGAPLSNDTIKLIIYDNLLKNREKYFVTPKDCPTAATDGESIYLNPYFTAWLTPKELAFTLAHEINHIMLRHVGDYNRTEAFVYGKQLKNKNDIDKTQSGLYEFRSNISNIAEDLIINDQLVKDRIGDIVVFKNGPKKGQNVVCYIPGFSDLSTEESIIKFTNAVCKNGFELVNKSFRSNGVNVKPPTYKKSENLTDARNELEVLYNYIFENAKQFLQQMQNVHEENMNGSSSMGSAQAQNQDGTGVQGDADNGCQNNQGVSEGCSDQHQNTASSSGGGSSINKSGQSQTSDKQSPGANHNGNRNPKGKNHMPPRLDKDGSLDDMAKGAISSAIDNVLNSQSMNKTAEEIAQAIAKAIADGTGGGVSLDSHRTTEDLINDIAQENNRDASEIEKQISEASAVLSSKILEQLEAMGVTPEQLKGIGHIGANVVAKWTARQVKARRPYDSMMMRMFKLIKGISRDTYARHNKKTTVINKALKNYARKTAQEPSRVIIPNKLSEAGKIVIAIDTSGSIFADPKVGQMAVEEILRLTDILNRQYTGSTIEVLMCDTQVHVYGQAHNKYEMQKLLDTVKNNGLDVVGGGGTDLLPIWKYVMDEAKNARKKGQMPPSGLMVLTDTYTSNIEEITGLYTDKTFRLPTVILATSNDIQHCKIWRELAQKCPYFMLADIDKIKEREQIRKSQSYGPER